MKRGYSKYKVTSGRLGVRYTLRHLFSEPYYADGGHKHYDQHVTTFGIDWDAAVAKAKAFVAENDPGASLEANHFELNEKAADSHKATMPYGKHAGMDVRDIVKTDPDYFKSVMKWGRSLTKKHNRRVLPFLNEALGYDFEEAVKEVEAEERAKEDAKVAAVDALWVKVESSEWVGEVGKREDFEVEVVHKSWHDNHYGGFNIVVMKIDDKKKLVWFGTGEGLEKGDKAKIKATVKEHAEREVENLWDDELKTMVPLRKLEGELNAWGEGNWTFPMEKSTKVNRVKVLEKKETEDAASSEKSV